MSNVQDTLNERQGTHGDFTEQADTAYGLKELYKDAMSASTIGNVLMSDQIEALDMICTKISRIIHGNPNEADHWHDIAGYAQLVANRLEHGKSHLGKIPPAPPSVTVRDEKNGVEQVPVTNPDGSITYVTREIKPTQ